MDYCTRGTGAVVSIWAVGIVPAAQRMFCRAMVGRVWMMMMLLKGTQVHTNAHAAESSLEFSMDALDVFAGPEFPDAGKGELL